MVQRYIQHKDISSILLAAREPFLQFKKGHVMVIEVGKPQHFFESKVIIATL
jgi:hypothetical protein